MSKDKLETLMIQLAPEVVARNWDGIGHYIAQVLGPQHQNGSMQRMLTAITSGQAECWTLVERRPDKPCVLAIVVTAVTVDSITACKNLMIYAMYGAPRIAMWQWQVGYQQLQEHARKKGCKKIFAFSDVPDVFKLVDRLGGKHEVRLIELEVSDGCESPV